MWIPLPNRTLTYSLGVIRAAWRRSEFAWLVIGRSGANGVVGKPLRGQSMGQSRGQLPRGGTAGSVCLRGRGKAESSGALGAVLALNL